MDKQVKTQTSDYNSELKLKGFKVYETNSNDSAGHNYSRKDFYKICITTGKFIFHYADKSFDSEPKSAGQNCVSSDQSQTGKTNCNGKQQKQRWKFRNFQSMYF